MRVLFSGLQAPGHTYPLIALAVAARRAGHEVTFVAAPNFHPLLKEQGFAVEAAGIPAAEAFARSVRRKGLDPAAGVDQLAPELFGELVLRTFGSVLPRAFGRDIGPILERVRPDLVVQEISNPGVGLTAAHAGIPVLCHNFGRVEAIYARTEGYDGGLRNYAAELGVTLAEEDLTTLGNRCVDISPVSLQNKDFLTSADRVPLRPTAPPTPRARGRWLPPAERHRPLVYLTLGTQLGTPEVYRQALSGLSRLDVDVLVSTGRMVDPAALGDLPGNVRVECWVSQWEVLHRVDAAVHHGGSGTTLGALSAGVPQLLIPQGADGFTNAAAVAEAGAGEQVLPDEFDADRVATSVKRLLDEDGFTAATRRIAAEIAEMPSADEIAARLPEFA